MTRKPGLVFAVLLLSSPGHAERPVLKAEPREREHGPHAEQARALRHGQKLDKPREGPKAMAGGMRGSLGAVWSEGTEPGLGAELSVMNVLLTAYRSSGLLLISQVGAHYWEAREASGWALSTTLWLGARSPVLWGGLGIAVDPVLVDRVDGQRGIGVYAPGAGAMLGAQIDALYLAVEGRARYRWQWGAPDRGQLGVGLALGALWEQPLEPVQH